ncbi:MAG: type II toxin-antitoxin system VapC family toxin [Anaerolineales bacterium]
MSEHVLDASALLALLNAEKGAHLVQELLPQAVISTVNLAEVVTRLTAIGMSETEIRETLALLGLETIPFDEEQAYQAGLLYPTTHPLGLSLGDRACLALAKTTGTTAITADRAWGDLDAGIGINLIR